MLANRLKKVLSKVVLKSHNTFVEGKQILDAILITNEAIDSMLKSNMLGMLCKLDIVKAYDHVSWEFLLTVLNKMGFGHKWINWISWCISSPKFFVIVNGTPLRFFQSSRGYIY